ncbi:hypothetical protein [Polynucleobacter sp. AP-Latsch-80-C2]|jgi:hypothetical protein|uniref:hypothetical protein n=1 Tax=Polynucleobacter sp. AP-Latsch-80-C2 TaxID=2576931 RepID=UPI001C0B59E1|nr:hypothetical protein [Polynucleobacter sp. AP-Latsch-80-C2]MBU3623759.1 hypothetical protein [Polynucleobacter sp. AP-Latsch-80-C2]
MLSLKKIVKNCAIICAVVLCTLTVVDLIAYLASPNQGIGLVPAYKKDRFQEKLREAIHYFPRGYNTADQVMGFDIAKNVAPVTFNMADGSFPIFSNDIGCFDHHTLAEIKAAKSYDYFAGDSFAWGYGNYEQNIPSTYEKLSGRFTVKCGIIHSGQRHQFEKFQRTVKLIGHPPKRAILTFYENDVANDYAYPHTTVIDGYAVDLYKFDPSQFQLVPRDINQIKQDIVGGINPETQSLNTQVDAWLDGHSLVWNLFKIGAKQAKGKDLATIYGISEGVNYGKNKDYGTAEITKRNREGLDLWINDAKKQKYELVIILIPPKIHHANTNFYGGFRDYLVVKKVRFLDLTQQFNASKKRSEELYWLNDGHLHNEGNIFVGGYLAKELNSK